jgi:NAD(P)H-nitrite reductase large subunit
MSRPMPLRHVIIGTGIAGLSAAERIRERDATADITLVGDEPDVFYSRPGIAYLLRGDVPERQLFIRGDDEIRSLRIARVNSRAIRADTEAHVVHLENGRTLAYDRLLVATGAQALPPQFPGADLDGIVKLDSLADCRRIIRSCGWWRAAVVVGGGITALELAEGLRARGMKTHYFLRGNRYWSDVLDETESRIVLDRLRHEGVRVHLETQIARAVGARGKLTAVETQNGPSVPCQILAVAIGVRPRLEFAQESGLAIDRGILVDEFLETSVADVFAAGDCAQVRDPVTGVASLDVLWPIALRQGRIVGDTMAGLQTQYVKEVPYNVTQLAGLKVTIIGSVGGGMKNDDLVAVSRGESEAWRMIPRATAVSRSDGVNRVRLVLDEWCIVGALVMGDQTWSRPLEQLIRQRVDITEIRPVLVADRPDRLDRLAIFYDRWKRTNGMPARAGAP